MVVAWNIAVELRPLFEYLAGHGPCIDVADTFIKLWRNLVLASFEVPGVAVSEFEWPQDSKTFAKKLPKDVAAVVMLIEDEAFSQAWPGKVVDCI